MLASRTGQSILVEHVIIFFMVIAAVSTMTVYVQRALQARMRDAKIYMVNMAASGCSQAKGTIKVDGEDVEVDCLKAANATNDRFAYEYEPYYTQVASGVGRQSSDTKFLQGKIAGKRFADQTQVKSTSNQAAPAYAK